MKPLNRVAIVGVGLIGGSIGLAVRRAGLAREIVGVGRRETSLATAKQRGAVDRVTTDLAEGVRQAELVIVCTPVDLVAQHVRLAAAACQPETLITDAGSTKVHIVREVEEAAQRENWPAGVRYLGSHPLAGDHNSGPESAREDLFDDRMVVVTPTPETPDVDLHRLRRFWLALGASVVTMSAEQHDRAIAATSHVPHLVAAVLAASTSKSDLSLAASGWKGTTRVAAGDPHLWRQIALANRENVLAALGTVERNIAKLRAALEHEDGDKLESLLREAKQNRDAVGS
jgi:prephenate dehydrogenase